MITSTETYNLPTTSYKCVMGVLDNPLGHSIKNELIQQLGTIYSIKCIIHDGKEFERPGIECALEECIREDVPVLYLHTKGAGNPIPSNSKKNIYMGPRVKYPKGVELGDWHKAVRNLWIHEFTTNYEAYFDAVAVDYPCVSCIYTGPHGETWTNAFVINKKAAEAILPLPYCDRLMYQRLFRNIKRVGIRMDDIWGNKIPVMHTDIWSFY